MVEDNQTENFIKRLSQSSLVEEIIDKKFENETFRITLKLDKNLSRIGSKLGYAHEILFQKFEKFVPYNFKLSNMLFEFNEGEILCKVILKMKQNVNG